jgi:protein O-GlcNAc transferase
MEAGLFDAAIELLNSAIAAAPREPMAHALRGYALVMAGRLDDAIAAYRQCLFHSPNLADVHFNLGHALQQQRQWEPAIASYRQAIALKPNFPEALNNLANVLRELGRLDDSIAAYRQALALRPNHASALLGLGNALRDQGMMTEAIAAYQRGVELAPDLPEGHYNLGLALQSSGAIDAAAAEYRTALALRADYSEAMNNLGNIMQEQGELDEAIDLYRAASAGGRSAVAHSNLLYASHFHASYDMAAIAAEHRRWNEIYGRPLAPPADTVARAHDSSQKRIAERPLRIGYVSPHFRHHPVGRFLLPLLSHHDRDSFQIVCYSDTTKPDQITQRLRSFAHEWKETAALSHEQLAQLIRSDRIDLLVDLTLHMQGSRMLTFAQKPAPLQLTYLAYCSTSGLEVMDYRFTDPYLDPPEEPTPHYTERSVHLKTYWCYPAPEEAPPVEPPPALQNGYVTFGCLNSYYKVTPATWGMWIEILRALPTSRLIIHSVEGSHHDRARQRLREAGIDPARLRFVGRVLPVEYFRLYQEIDIALDPFPHGGGTTSCDALWMGVPLITLAGQTPVSRGGLSILSNLRLQQYAARTSDEYVAIAASLAQNPSELAELRSTLRDQMRRSLLMDEPAFARDVERAYGEICTTKP